MPGPAEEEASIRYSSVALVAVLGFFLYRYFISNRSSRPSRPQYTSAQVEQIVQVFPQLSRRDIMYDLHQNGGRVQATMERVLSGRSLPPAPPTFEPPFPTSAPSASASATSAKPPTKPEPDLITRYNLQGRVNSKGKERAEDASSLSGWAANKDQRQQILQRRRDEMILAARRKIQEKDEQNAVS